MCRCTKGWVAALGLMMLLGGHALAQEEVTVEVDTGATSIFLSPVGDVFYWKKSENGIYGWRNGRGAQHLGSRVRSSYEMDLFMPWVQFAGSMALLYPIANGAENPPPPGTLWDATGFAAPYPEHVWYLGGSRDGLVVGGAVEGEVVVPFLRTPGGARLALETVGDAPSVATEVNNAGQAVGRQAMFFGAGVEILLWLPSEPPLVLGEFKESPRIEPVICETGAVLYATHSGGYAAPAALWYRESGGTTHELGYVDYVDSTLRSFLGESGVAAWYDQIEHALVAFDPTQGTADIWRNEGGKESAKAGAHTHICGVNARGQVAGRIAEVPFLWDRANGRTDMPTTGLYAVLDDLGRVAWVQQPNQTLPWTLYLRHTDGTIETLAEGTSWLDEDYPIVALNALGQVAWADEDEEGNWTLYLRGPVDTMTDSDGDARSDEVEGKNAAKGPRDSDSDGTPDYLDMDSDNDGLGDAYDPTAYDTQNPTPFPLHAWAVGIGLLVVFATGLSVRVGVRI